MPGPSSVIARRAFTSSSRRERRAAAPDQRAELRPLQDLRHQGPDPEHQLGRSRRRWRPQLSEHVNGSRGSCDCRCWASRRRPSARFSDPRPRTYVEARAAAIERRPCPVGAAACSACARRSPGRSTSRSKALSEAIGAGQYGPRAQLAAAVPAAKLPIDARLLLVAEDDQATAVPIAPWQWLAAKGDTGDLIFLAPLLRPGTRLSAAISNKALAALDAIPTRIACLRRCVTRSAPSSCSSSGALRKRSRLLGAPSALPGPREPPPAGVRRWFPCRRRQGAGADDHRRHGRW